MAFDALRLRNVIQLAGILRTFALRSTQLYLVHSTHLPSLVFHVALVVFSAIQIHETRTALVQPDSCDQGNLTYVVCPSFIHSFNLEVLYPSFSSDL